MSSKSLYRLAGILLVVGGLVAAFAHIIHPNEPKDPIHLLHYAAVSQPAHLLLFSAINLVLLALPALFHCYRRSVNLLGFIGFLFLYFGISFADMLHCILEFSIFPVLMRSVPYATFSIVNTTYSSTPLAILQNTGSVFVFVGVVLSAIAVARVRDFSPWFAAPLFLTAVLMVAAFLPFSSRLVGPHFVTSLYLSLAIFGVTLLRKKSDSSTATILARLSRPTRG